jgi:hypothetical protein
VLRATWRDQLRARRQRESRPRRQTTEEPRSAEARADLWALGRWSDRVAEPWERAVAASIDSIAAEAERRAGR